MNEQRHEDPGAGTGVGIDPDALDELISQARSIIGGIEDFTSTYRSRFNQAGVTTSNINKQEEVAEWINDQLPMLERRRDIAQIAGEASPGTFVQTGAGDIGWDTGDEAAKEAKADAERLLEGLGPGDEIPDEVYELLRDHSFDPDYLEAFFNAAGSETLPLILADAYEGPGDNDYDKSKLARTSFALATASHRIDFTSEEWMEGIETHHSNGWITMAKFMNHGHWDEGFLHSAMDNLGQQDHPADVATVMEALARHPVAAANWFQGSPPDDHRFDTNADYAAAIMQGHGLPRQFAGDAVNEAFLAIMESATNGVARYSQDLADKSVYLLLETVHDMEDQVAQHIFREWFAVVIERHIDDLYDSVTSPVDAYYDELRDSRDGVEAPKDWWASLTEQAMRDEKSAAYLSVIFETKYQEIRADWVAGPSKEDQDANSYYLAQSRQFAGWFVKRNENVAEALQKDVDDWNQSIEDAIDLLFDPPNPKDLALEIAEDKAKSLVVDALKRPDPSWDVDIEWTDSESFLWSDVDLSYTRNRNDDGTLPEVEIAEYDEHGNQTGTTTYDGNPATYEERYGGKFTDENGNLLPVDQMDEAGIRAYMEWVRDPAVVNQYWNDFSATFPGLKES